MKEDNKNIPFLKIVYFDEEAATDLIYMNNKGMIVDSIKNNEKSKYGTNVSGEASGKTNIFSMLSAKFKIGSDISLGSEKLINRVITNTVLTDYLNLIKDGSLVKNFDKATVYPHINSLTHVKLITPYMLMTEGKMNTGDIMLNTQRMDEALNNGKGYFEMLLNNNEVKPILRFNLKSFKNSYSLPDLVKMELTYHAVRVGKTKLSNLDASKEFAYKDISKEVDGYELGNNVEESSEKDLEKDLEVYDVLFAGVKND